MLSSELGDKEGLCSSTIRMLIKKLYPDFFGSHAPTQIHDDMLPSIYKAIEEYKKRKEGLSRAELCRRFNVTEHTAKLTLIAMGLHGIGAKMPKDRLEEFEIRASKKTDRRQEEELVTEKVNKMYSIMMSKGYVLGSELKKEFNKRSYNEIVSHFDSREKYIYECDITIYSKKTFHGKEIDDYQVWHVKAFRPFAIISRIWKNEREVGGAHIKNGYIRTNDRSMIGAHSIA